MVKKTKLVRRYIPIGIIVILAVLCGFIYNIWVIYSTSEEVLIDENKLVADENSNSLLNLEQTYLYNMTGDRILGIAKRSYKNNTFILAAELNISEEVAIKKECRIYISKPNSEGIIKVGTIKVGSGKSYVVFEESENLKNYSSVYVTRVLDGGTREIKLMEGSFRYN